MNTMTSSLLFATVEHIVIHILSSDLLETLQKPTTTPAKPVFVPHHLTQNISIPTAKPGKNAMKIVKTKIKFGLPPKTSALKITELDINC
jgi:hypothetical protein